MSNYDLANLLYLNFNDIIERMNTARSAVTAQYVNYPPVDVLKKGNYWLLNIALAGYQEKDISISTEGELLIVKGGKQDESDKVEYVHRGISKKSFERRWVLDPDMEVIGVSFTDGMLSIGIVKVVPEAKKPKQLNINSGMSIKDMQTKLLD